MKTRVSMTKDCKSTECKDCELEKIIDGIRVGKWKVKVEEVRAKRLADDKEASRALKDKLPAFTPSGTFRQRRADQLADYSFLVVADFDDLGESLAKVRDSLNPSLHLLALFLSPSGNGLKALFRVASGPDRHKQAFAAVARHCKVLTGADIDHTGSDICRLCIVSYDPDLLWKPEAIPMPCDDPGGNPKCHTVVQCPSVPVSQCSSVPVVQEISSPPPPLDLPAIIAEIQQRDLIPTAPHQTKDLLFKLSRLCKSFSEKLGRELTPAELDSVFDAWIGLAKERDAAFVWREEEEYGLEFHGIYRATKYSLDEGPLKLAVELAATEAPPPEAERFSEGPIRKLIAFCYQLARLSDGEPGCFFLSCYSAAPVCGRTPRQANRWLNSLAKRGGVIELLKKGGNLTLKPGSKGKREASLYRWIGSDPSQGTTIATPVAGAETS